MKLEYNTEAILFHKTSGRNLSR